MIDGSNSAAEIAAAVSSGKVSARAVVDATLARIASVNPRVNAFTDVTAERARQTADALDARRARGETLGPLAGVPFAVKNLIDVAGLPTRAGSKINRDLPPASRDGALVRRLEAAGAILVGALNMGEYAYDFTGENVHDGPSRNPHALEHMTGGSSGGSGAAIAAGLVPIALGSDTNGSIRVPSAFCGTFGLKPTYGRLSRAGSFPFVGSFDHLGPLARSAADLALAYDAMQGHDPDDPVSTSRAPEPALPEMERASSDLRVAIAGGYFARQGDPDCFAALAKVAHALDATRTIELPEAARARAAAYVITAAEGAALHLDRLRERAADYDPAVRDRLIAGSAIPAAWVIKAQRFRRWYRERVLALFNEVDIILAPATPCRAPKIGQQTFVLDGVTHAGAPEYRHLHAADFVHRLTRCRRFPCGSTRGLPLGVQIIAAPWKEAHALRIARALEQADIADARIAAL